MAWKYARTVVRFEIGDIPELQPGYRAHQIGTVFDSAPDYHCLVCAMAKPGEMEHKLKNCVPNMYAGFFN